MRLPRQLATGLHSLALDNEAVSQTIPHTTCSRMCVCRGHLPCRPSSTVLSFCPQEFKISQHWGARESSTTSCLLSHNTTAGCEYITLVTFPNSMRPGLQGPEEVLGHVVIHSYRWSSRLPPQGFRGQRLRIFFKDCFSSF